MTARLVTYAVGMALTVLLMLAWALVQSAWRRAFPTFDAAETDVLAARGGGCGRCTCGGGVCTKPVEPESSS
jgi:hypothetical protein